MATKKKNESNNQWVLTPSKPPNTKRCYNKWYYNGYKKLKNMQKQQANTQAASDARQGAGMSRIGTAPKVNKSRF